LSDPLMQERIREDGANLEPSCTLDNPLFDPNDPYSEELATKAYPARRITEVAQGFGENGVIESICQDNFTGAMDSIIGAISKQLRGVCLPRKLKRNSDGLVECDVVWSMPPGQGCDLPFLQPPEPGRPQTKGGKILCVVRQVPVVNVDVEDPAQALAPGVTGWYYDDFSADRLKDCKGDPNNLQRVAFTMFSGQTGEETADPPAGTTVELQCLNEVQSIVGAEETAAIKVGFECNVDQECGPLPMRCHPKARTCVITCGSNADCPAAWACDTELETVFAQRAEFPLCVNPTCGN
jgi:hypothetical protein